MIISGRDLDLIEARALRRLDEIEVRVGILLEGERADANGQERGQPIQDGEADGGELGSADGSEPRDQRPPDTPRPEDQQAQQEEVIG